jgi:ferritin
MISKTMEKALNEQAREELNSFYIYLAMSAYLEEQNYRGMAKWMSVQAKEELGHAMKFIHYLLERGGKVTLAALDAPKATWKTPLAVFKTGLTHERYITKCIYTLVEKAAAEKDHGTVNFLQYFVKEQVEEEANAEPIVAKLEMAGDNLGALFYLDHELGGRSE